MNTLTKILHRAGKVKLSVRKVQVLFHFRHHFAHFATCHHLHHLAGLLKLFEQSVDFLNVGTATFGYACTARTVKRAGLERSFGVME